MAVVLLVALTIGSAALARSRFQPSEAESQALADYNQAKLNREVAEYAMKEYIDTTFALERATAQNQVAAAESDRKKAEDRLKWSTEMLEKGKVSPETKTADQLTLLAADFDIEQAKLELEVLEKYTRQKQRKKLVTDIEKARADEASKQAIYQEARTRRLWWGK
jgi:hypothetical protein